MTTRKYTRRNPAPPKPRASTIKIPEHVSPAVRLVFEEMKRLGVTYYAIEEMSGVLRVTVKSWRHRTNPSLTSISAVLGSLGWEFIPIPRERILPEEIVDELRPIAARMNLAMPEAIGLLTEIAYRAKAGASSAKTPTEPRPALA